MAKTIDFTKGNMAKNVACFALPLLCANLVQLLYSAADALFAGNVEGTAGIAAIGASSLAVTCVVSFLSGFSEPRHLPTQQTERKIRLAKSLSTGPL